MTATPERIDLRVGHMRHESLSRWVLLEEVFDVIGTILGTEILVIAIDGGREPAEQRVMGIAREKRVPVGPPKYLDDIPASAGKERLQFLDDLAIAAHGSVEALQVTIDDEREIVEPLPGRQGECADRFRFIHFAVAEHAPDPAFCRVGES